MYELAVTARGARLEVVSNGQGRRRSGWTLKAAVSIAAMVLASSVLAAPLTLTGDYINVGVSDWGTFGQNGGAEPGIQYDKTGLRAFDDDYDYLTPGTPFDGFSVTFDATTVSNNNNAGSGRQINGVLTDESGNGADHRGVERHLQRRHRRLHRHPRFLVQRRRPAHHHPHHHQGRTRPDRRPVLPPERP